MPSYTQETSDIPCLFILRPTFNAAQAVTAAEASFSWKVRIKNDADAADFILRDSKSISFDMLGAKAGSVVNVAGLGNITYAQIAAAIKKMGDAERALLP